MRECIEDGFGGGVGEGGREVPVPRAPASVSRSAHGGGPPNKREIYQTRHNAINFQLTGTLTFSTTSLAVTLAARFLPALIASRAASDILCLLPWPCALLLVFSGIIVPPFVDIDVGSA